MADVGIPAGERPDLADTPIHAEADSAEAASTAMAVGALEQHAGQDEQVRQTCLRSALSVLSG